MKKKKHIVGPYQWTYAPNLVQTGTYLGIEMVPLLFLLRTHSLTTMFVIGHFVVQKVWKVDKIFFRSIGGQYLWKFVYHNASLARIKIKDSLISYENWIAKRHQSRGTYAHIFMKVETEQIFSNFLYYQTMSIIPNSYVKLTDTTRFARDGNACGILFLVIKD